MTTHLEPGFAIHLGQLQAVENLVAAWKAHRKLWEPMTMDWADAFEELDMASHEAEKVCREIRGMGS